MNLLFELINFLYLLIEIIKKYWLYFLIIIIIFFLFKLKKDYRKSELFLQNKTGFIILDGLFETGKTRFMSQLAKDSQKNGRFVLSNYYNGYNFVKWNSLTDLLLLLNDIWLLGEYQNFTEEQIKKMYSQDNKERLKEKLETRKKIAKKYKYIPCNGYHNNFLILGDEFQNYFFNRSSMSNFAGENKKLLKLFHQVRHFNSLVILGTQNSQELDVKFRRLSTYYINTGTQLNGLVYYYNVYEFLTDKENNLNLEMAKKFTKIPVFKINIYFFNKIINKIQIKSNKLNKYHNFLNKIFRKNIFNERIIKFRFKQLDFETKYNVDPDINTYHSEDLFKKLNEFYKNNNIYYLTDLN